MFFTRIFVKPWDHIQAPEGWFPVHQPRADQVPTLEKVDDSTEARPWRNGKAVGNFGNDSLVEMASYTILGQAGWDLWSHFHGLGSLQSRLPSSTYNQTHASLIWAKCMAHQKDVSSIRRNTHSTSRSRPTKTTKQEPKRQGRSPRAPPKLLKLFYTIIWKQASSL